MISKNGIEKLLRPAIPHFLMIKWKNFWSKKNFKQWQKAGCPNPPPHLIKEITIQEYQKLYALDTLVETGTYLGEMIEAQKSRFKKIISIELGVSLFKKAKKRFKNDKNVVIVQGDSGKVLPEIMKEINDPAIFWLDGHYSSGITAKGERECPIFEELEAILNNNRFNHILLIDDARCFVGEKDYPTIENLTKYVRSKNEKYQVNIKHDIISYTI